MLSCQLAGHAKADTKTGHGLPPPRTRIDHPLHWAKDGPSIDPLGSVRPVWCGRRGTVCVGLEGGRSSQERAFTDKATACSF